MSIYHHAKEGDKIQQGYNMNMLQQRECLFVAYFLKGIVGFLVVLQKNLLWCVLCHCIFSFRLCCKCTLDPP